jgi:hypothetical protein
MPEEPLFDYCGMHLHGLVVSNREADDTQEEPEYEPTLYEY